jgi:anti-anti-sigma regulatory factor
MPHKSSSHHLPQEIYHRIYWYAKRNVDPRVIAHTLRIPLKTVEHLIEKLSSPDQLKHAETRSHEEHTRVYSHHSHAHAPALQADFLDVFTFEKTRYTVIDISGMATGANIEKLHTELKRLLASEFKAVALRMTDVKAIDEQGFNAICAFYDAFINMRRYTAILDPSPEVDSFMAGMQVDKKIPVFGTETAFEEKAFR